MKINNKLGIIAGIIGAVLTGLTLFTSILFRHEDKQEKAKEKEEEAKKLPFIELDSPADGSDVRKFFRLKGRARNIPVGRYLWLVRQKSGRPNLVQPYDKGIILRHTEKGSPPSFSKKVKSVPNEDGSETGRLRTYKILMIDNNTRKDILDYLKNSLKNASYGGFPLEASYDELLTFKLRRLADE